MSLRCHLKKLGAQDNLIRISTPISKACEAAGVLKALEPGAVYFERVKESAYPLIGNLLCNKTSFADYLGLPLSEIIPRLVQAINQRYPCPVVGKAPCQEVVKLQPDLDDLPILRHFETDGGNYITSGVVIAHHPKWGQNVDFHRCMQFSKTEMAVRVVRGRHFDTFLNDLGEVDVAICIGNSPNVLVAAATSVDIGVNELEIANALEAVPVVHAMTVDVYIPAEAEFVLEGTIYRDRRHSEGPFVDLTETQDIVRQEPVFEVKAITHRQNAIWQALLPGGLEHKLLMSLPRLPTIFRKVNEVTKCLDVNITPGGCSWLHVIVQIEKQNEDDGRKAIHAAFTGHRSCKHVFVVDKDIDIYDPQAVEWAMATRFQGDRQLVIMEKEPGSSLDPSSDLGTHLTTKIGFDLTKPLSSKGKTFEKVTYPIVDLEKYLGKKSKLA